MYIWEERRTVATAGATATTMGGRGRMRRGKNTEELGEREKERNIKVQVLE